MMEQVLAEPTAQAEKNIMVMLSVKRLEDGNWEIEYLINRRVDAVADCADMQRLLCD